MQLTIRRAAQCALTIAVACMCIASALAAPTNNFEPAAVVQGSNLVLNGSGTRYKAIFKVYDMAMYLPHKAKTSEEVLAMPGPKKLSFVALRDLPGTDLGLTFVKGLSSNSSPDQIQKHSVASTRLIEIFSGRSKLSPGDTFAMEFVPGKGTTFFIQGQPQGAPVGDAEYFAMILKIWLGPVPADFKLKDALLQTP